MKVFILCGGMGTRLREHTETRPKPMVEVGGIPMVVHIMRSYAAADMTDFVLCLGYKGNVIRDYFLNYEAMNRDFTVELGKPGAITYHGLSDDEARWRVTLCETGEASMTGARIHRAVGRFLDSADEAFAVTYGDGVSNVDLAAVLKFHRDNGKLATVTGVRPPSRFGEIERDGVLVRAFNEKPQVAEGLINGGFFFFQREFLQYLTSDEGCILEREPLSRCAKEGQLAVYAHGGFWHCMDTFRDWEQLEAYWREGHPPWVAERRGSQSLRPAARKR